MSRPAGKKISSNPAKKKTKNYPIRLECINTNGEIKTHFKFFSGKEEQ